MGETLSVQGSTTAAPARRSKAKATAQTSRVRLLAAGAAGVAVFVIGVGIGFAGSADRLADGVTVAGIDVGGLSPAAAKALLAERAEAQAAIPVTFTAGGQTWDIAPKELGVVEDWDAAVDEAMAKGGGSTLIRGFRRIGLRLSPVDVEPAVHAYDNAVKYKVSLLAEDVDRPHRDARLVRHGMSFELVGGQIGRKLDRDAAVGLVVGALASSPREPVSLPVEADPPKVTVAQLRPVRARAARVVSGPVTLKIGIANFVVEPKKLAAMLELPSGGTSDLRFGGPVANAYFRKLDRDVSSPAKDAGFSVGSGGAISVTPAQKGVALDVRKTAAHLLAAAQRAQPRTASIVVGTSLPSRSTAEAKAMGITGLVGSYETIYGGIANRIHNVQLVAKLIDGKLIAPGATFSFNDATGERTADKGFLEAPVIINGELETGLGGGVCQVSTTVFNAAYEAGLPITSRTNHALYISHYPLGRDATVDYPNIDLKFVNDTGKWLLLRTFVGASSLVVNLYGTPQDRRVETETAPLRTVAAAPVERRFDRSVAPGEEVVAEYGVPATATSVHRIVYAPSGKVLSDSTWVSNYESEPSVILYGPKKTAKKPAKQGKAGKTTPDDAEVTPATTGPAPPQ
jgi:vancomycin resistance protein YoaR